MCNPLMIAGAVMTVASIAAKSQADKKVQKARTGAMEAERTRQRGYDEETQALNTQSQDRYGKFDEKQSETAKSLGDYFQSRQQALTDNPAEPDPGMPAASSNITVREEQKQLGKAQAYGDQQAGAMGNLRAFGDLLGGISREQARDAGQIGVLGGFKRGSSAIMPLELEAANGKGRNLRMLGDVLGVAGSAMMSGGLAGGAGAAAGAAASTGTSSAVGNASGPVAGASGAAQTPLFTMYSPYASSIQRAPLYGGR